jgi:hypothetical protein
MGFNELSLFLKETVCSTYLSDFHINKDSVSHLVSYLVSEVFVKPDGTNGSNVTRCSNIDLFKFH